MKSGAAVLVLLNGELRDARRVKSLARRAGAVVCADGGARHAASLGLTPNAIVGDMDSLPKNLPRSWKKTAYVCDFDENHSDLDKTLDFCTAMGAGKLWICAALGGGLDHEFVNLAAVESWKGRAQITLHGAGAATLLNGGRHNLNLKPNSRFSLLAAPTARVTLTGAKYPLKNFPLTRGSRGLGNRTTGRAALTVHTGRVWLMIDAADFKG